MDEELLDIPPFAKAVRRRPGFYIGPLDHRAIYCLIRYVCHALCETAQADEKQRLCIEVKADQSIEFQANYRPNVFAQMKSKEQLDQLFSRIPFDLGHPIPRLASVSALSSDFQIKLQTNEGVISTRFPAGELAEQEPEELAELLSPTELLSIRFWPDLTILKGWDGYDGKVLCEQLKQLIVWNRVAIRYRDPHLETAVVLHYPDGVRSRLAEQLGEQDDKQGMLLYCSQTSPTIQAEVAIYWDEELEFSEWGVVNRHIPPEGGTHLEGMWHGFIEALDHYLRQQGWLSADAPQLKMAQLPQGLRACVAIQAEKVDYGAANRQLISDAELGSFMRRMVREQLANQFDQRPDLVRAWAEEKL